MTAVSEHELHWRRYRRHKHHSCSKRCNGKWLGERNRKAQQ